MATNKYLAFVTLLLLQPQAIAGLVKHVPPPADKLLSTQKEWGHIFSPGGKYIAHVESAQTTNYIEITDLALLKIISRINLNGRFGSGLVWLNDRELAFETNGKIIAMNTRGEDRRILIDNVYDADSENKADREYRNWNLFATLPDDREHILVSSAGKDNDWKWTNIHKINIYTGEKEDIESGGELDIDSWFVDTLGNLRAAKKKEDDSSTYFLYEAGKDGAELKPLLGKKSGINFYTKNNSSLSIHAVIAGFSLKESLIYTEERITGDRYKLVTYDPVEDRVVNVILEDDFYDIDSTLRFNTRTRDLLGFSFLLDKHKNIWLDKTMQDYQQKIDALSPDTFNDVIQWSPDFGYLLVDKSNAKGMDSIAIYTAKTNTLTTLSDHRPGLTEYTLAETRRITYQARDGYTLEGFLTIPPNSGGKKPLPIIVNMLDGLWSRHVSGYSAVHQFFATRGYAVFRPNPRGTSGRGKKHLALDSEDLFALMQDDIADGVKSLIKDGTADANRIFLHGKYYGGHMAISSAISYPDLYKGVVSKGGVLNLAEQYEFLDDNEYYIDMDFWHALLNSEKPSKKLLQQHSPRHLIKDIKTPLLLFHGKDDSVVNVEQAKDFKEAAEELNNKNITVKLIDKEGNGDWDSNNDIYFLEKSLEFYEKNAAAKSP